MKSLLLFTVFGGFFINFAFSQVLKIDSVSRYNCQINNNLNNYLKTFFFVNQLRPDSILDTTHAHCHDVSYYGSTDDVSYPRLNEKSSVFSLWSKTDILFFDIDNNGSIDIHDTISEKIGSEVKNIFIPMSLNLGLKEGTRELGYYMNLVYNPDSYQFECPVQHETYHNNLLNVLKSILGTDTEMLFKADEVYSELERKDMFYISQTDVEKIWFINDNGTKRAPTSTELNRYNVYFNWPANLEDPYTQSSTQRLFKLERNLKKQRLAYGCVPVLNN